ncbi:MAG: PQQ-binding-like beta-propeller repeat protein [Planctomycetaceae bacterium]
MTRKGQYCGVHLKGVSQFAFVSCLVVLTLIGSARWVCAQRNLLGKDAPEPADDLQRLPTDRKIAQQLQELTRLARGGNIAKIRDTLQLLQAADPSLMVADGSATFRPLHRDLIERIQEFPPELQTGLLKHPGATPRALQIAWEDGGPAALVTFLHRHSGSSESFRAHLFLAAIHRDRGHRQATLYWLLPVLHSSAPSDLQKIAIAMRDELSEAIVIRSTKGANTGSDVELSPKAEAGSEDATTDPLNPDVPALEVDEAKAGDSEQTVDMPPGSATPNIASAEKSDTVSGVFPHSPAWQRMLHLASTQRHASQDLVRLLAEEGDQQAIAWMAGEPIVDSQAIYVRSSGGLLAFERKTGRVLWTRLLDRQQDVRRSTESRMRSSEGIDGDQLNALQLQNSREVLELHRDEVTAGITTDASRLFVLCDTGESAGTFPDFSAPFGMLQRRGDMISRSLRELVAIEKATGRRLWSAGGAPLEARFGNELSRAWFAGPPTVSGGLLYGVVERDDAHWLVCLRSETGEVVWKLMLAYPEINIFQDPNRQLTASRPLVADGMIWTSTNDGLLTAVDTLTRSVVWTRRMLQNPKETAIPQLRNLRNATLQAQAKPFRESWRPETMLLLSDSLLIQGADSHQLVMIDPLTGSVRRRISPDTATVILAVDDEFIVVAGPKKIQRLRLDNLKVDWDTALVATNVAPTGPGTRLDEHLLIPLSDGSIQIVRYSDGQLGDRIPALRPAFSAGGLKSIDGDVVSYGPDHVSLFSQTGTAPPLLPETIEQARFLIETGQFADAEKILAEFKPTSEETNSVHRLLFRIATARTLNDPAHRDDHLRNAARYAATSQDSAIVQFLTLETQPDITSDVIIDFLKAAPAVLNAELPDRALLKQQLLSPVADDPIGHRTFSAEPNFTTTRPMRNLLLQILEQHLADPDVSKCASWLSPGAAFE